MKFILCTILYLSIFAVGAQDFRHELTDPDDSVRLKGLKLYLEIDSVYQVSDSSGIKFALEMVNEGDKQLRLTNPLYDTELNVNFSIWQLPSKKELQLKEVSRWPNPRLAEDIKPYRLEKITISGSEVPSDQYKNYWETDTLDISPSQQIRYDMNLFEHVIFDEEVRFKMHFEPLPKGEYYVIFNVSLDISDSYIRSKPLRFRLRLE